MATILNSNLARFLRDALAFYVEHLEVEAKRDATPLSVIVKRFL